MFLRIGNEKIEVKIADTLKKKIQGLSFQENISYGLIIPNCNHIHTFFMKEPIDVIGLNLENKVIYIYRNLPKNQILKLNFSDIYVS